MDLLTLARAQQARQRALADRLVVLALARWAQLGRDDPGGTWMGLVPALVAALATAQRAAADGGAVYAGTAALELDAGDGEGEVVASAFAGVASDGRPLDSLLYLPMLAVRARTGAGMALTDALVVGREQLARIVSTQVHDAGRVATGVGIAARPRLGGYVRQIVGATCARCIVLAGRNYGALEGFQRHPHCDCIHVPWRRGGAEAPEPRQVFDGMTAEEQDRVFGRAGAQAIRDGADLGQVVNARRGIYTAGGRTFTTEGTTRRGLAGKQLEAAGAQLAKRAGQRYRRVTVPRLMPEQIYREAAGSRDEAIRLLRRFGYIT